MMLLQQTVIQTKICCNLCVEAEVTISSFFHLTYFTSQTVILRLMHISRALLVSALAKQPPRMWKNFNLITTIGVENEGKIRQPDRFLAWLHTGKMLRELVSQHWAGGW